MDTQYGTIAVSSYACRTDASPNDGNRAVTRSLARKSRNPDSPPSREVFDPGLATLPSRVRPNIRSQRMPTIQTV